MTNISKPKEDGWIGKTEDKTFWNYQLSEYKKSVSHCSKKRTAIDLGANIGMMTYRMAKEFHHVHAFEPLFFHNLEENVSKFHNVTVYPYAVGDKREMVTMRKGLYHSGGSNIINSKEKNQTYIENITVTTVDSYDFKEVDFIKIDVEYYEYQALRGCLKTIKDNRPILMVEIHDNNPNKKQIFSLLESIGYSWESIGEFDWVFKL